MQPYVPLIMPELQAALIDPLPEVRATAARAMGALLQGMGEGLSRSVMPWLLQTLKSEVRSMCMHSARPFRQPLTGQRTVYGHSQQLCTPRLTPLLADRSQLRRIPASPDLQGSSVERSGAAQGLAEAFAALGPAHLDALLPSILAQCTSKQVRPCCVAGMQVPAH